jgi:hypothetical protein
LHSKEPVMAASLVIEEERGTCVRSVHPHNGYYAGDFSGPSRRVPPTPLTSTTKEQSS